MSSYLLPHWLAHFISLFIPNKKCRHHFREFHDAKLLKKYFDEAYYLNKYPDVKASGVNPLEHYFLYGRKEGHFASLQEEMDNGGIKKVSFTPKEIQNINKKFIVIVTAKATQALAELIQNKLSKINISSSIVDDIPHYSPYENFVHIILCPQLFTNFPKYYFAVNLEQFSSSYLLTENYVDILEKAIAVLDFSIQNINYLTHLNFKYTQLFYIPLQAKISEIGRQQSIIEEQIEQPFDKFEFYFYRFLLSYDFITYNQFYETIGKKYPLPSAKICLSMPETTVRRDFFQNNKESKDYFLFDGLRHYIGWIGCGLSYKFLFQRASDLELPQILICEDDVVFLPNHSVRLKKIQAFLSEERDWDIFAGVIADFNEKTNIRSISFRDGECFVNIDKMVSNVYNIYNASSYKKISSWDSDNRDKTNTIDRYIEQSQSMSVITTAKFLVGHSETCNSSIWDFTGAYYNQLLSNSITLFIYKIGCYLIEQYSTRTSCKD